MLSCLLALVQYYGAASAFAPWVNYTKEGEAFANLRQRNQFSTLTNIGLAALLWWTSQLKPVARQVNLHRVWLVLAVLLALGNAVSSSRTGLVQWAMLAVLAVLWGGWRSVAVRRVLAVYAVTYVLALWVLPWSIGLEPFSNGAWARLKAGDSLCASRMTLWRNVLYLIEQRPWTGWGWGELDFAHFSTPYPGPRFCDILDNAHNLPLHLAVELGVPVAVAVCGLLVLLVWRARPWAEKDATRQMAWAVLALIGLHSLLEYPLWYGPFQIAVGLSVLLLCQKRPGLLDVDYRPKRHSLKLLQASVAALLIAICAYVGWDYHRISQIYLPPERRAEAYRDDTLVKASASWLFRDQVRFAELTTTTLTPQNAEHQYSLATELLHFSPEPKVVEILIESAVQLQRWDEVRIRLAQFHAAFPKEHADWAAHHHLPL
ncbi:PglL family O-oligosaccharyltransferase [Variovorax sp. HJSM1_2]|uniref:PglL family O-oligosaccharyltransferase n=1 Tax=Variovorax sp. HJSM1_2 TaxID=3366263 RepID=UPI003BF547A7